MSKLAFLSIICYYFDMAHEKQTTQSLEHNNNAIVEITAAELNREMNDLRNNPDIQHLIHDLAKDTHYDLSEGAFDSDEAFVEAAQATLDFRKGKTREETEAIVLSDETKNALDQVIDDLDMKRDTEPLQPHFDVAFIPGAAGIVPTKRLDYLVELMDKGKVDTDVIMMIGCERPVNMKPNAKGQNEIDRAGAAGHNQAGDIAQTEFDLMRNTAAVKFDIADEGWNTVAGTDVDIPEEYHRDWRIAYTTTKDGKTVCVTSAPMLTEEDRVYPDGNPRKRANTPDGYAMAADLLRDYFDHLPNGGSPRALTVTDAVFNRFQGNDARTTLAPEGIESETVGFTREHAGLPDWPGGETYYLQEILSSIKSTRKARDALTDISRENAS